MFGSSKKQEEAVDLSTKSNHLEKGTRVVGDIETTGNIRIDCDIEGNIRAKAKLVLGTTADIKGNINALNITGDTIYANTVIEPILDNSVDVGTSFKRFRSLNTVNGVAVIF